MQKLADRAKRREDKPLGKREKLELMQQAQRLYWTALPQVMEALIEGAKKGRATQLKILVELGGLEKGAMSRGGPEKKPKSLAKMLMDDLKRSRKEEAAAARLAAKHAAGERVVCGPAAEGEAQAADVMDRNGPAANRDTGERANGEEGGMHGV